LKKYFSTHVRPIIIKKTPILLNNISFDVIDYLELIEFCPFFTAIAAIFSLHGS